MGKTSKWIISFLTGKKDRYKGAPSTPPPTDNPANIPIAITPTTPKKEKRRWSFRRSTHTSPTTTNKYSNSMDNAAAPTMPSPPPPLPVQVNLDSEHEQKKHMMAMAVTTEVAADSAIAVVQAAAAAVIRLAAATTENQNSPVEEAAAIKIQSLFRSYLETGCSNTSVYAGIGDTAGKSPHSEDPNGGGCTAHLPEAIRTQKICK